ncbi:phage tail assembly chaperone [uncultured Pseudomonas sp.]|uniref:phage tail assembly chaperone n=1 Tax=uncultured Pseudomonas sp. TaxID=114707 RepID=UPI00258FF298|nr:phage tail assembly chaperone [uncultured Pseudomonas sp.]
MKYFRNLETGGVHAFAADGSEDDFIPGALVPMTAAEVEAHTNPPPTPKTQEQIEAAERAWRDAAVNAVLWLRERHRDEQDLQRSTTLTSERFAELLVYLQSLRDWPQSDAFPDAASRPHEPVWVQEAQA